MLTEEVEEAVRSLKAGKSPEVNNIPFELLKNGGRTTSPDSNMQEDLGEEGMAEGVDIITRHTFTQKKGNLRQCKNYTTISLISHPSKTMLRVVLNRLKAEEMLAEEQADFRPGRSTAEQIFNSRVIIEKHLQHQHDLFHNFVDFKKANDRV